VRRGLLVVALLVLAVVLPGQARAGQCGLPDVAPWSIDFADGTVPFRSVFARPGTIVASFGNVIPAQLRNAGAQTIYWEMHLERLVGTPQAPADPNGVVPAADALAAQAALSSGCATPLVALNELLGTTTPPPWDPSTTQYRANVLALVQELAAKGAHPYLLLPSNPNPTPELWSWWQQVGAVSDLVREVYFNAPSIEAQGPLLASRALRTKLRTSAVSLTTMGIPAAKVGLMLGFYSAGAQGRAGLQPREAWLDYVKLNVLAARAVATELQLATVWNWGWGVYSAAGQDADKPAAACVALWTRDQTLCDGPGQGLLDPSLTVGQIDPTAWCTFGDLRVTPEQLALARRVVPDDASAATLALERLAPTAARPVTAADLRGAERLVVARSFAGYRTAYTRALARAGITAGLARGVLADELRGLPTLEAQQALADTAICATDAVPAAGAVRAADTLPFLRLR
jgi:hypothetical protein